MFGFFKRDPDKKIKAEIEALYKKSVDAQRNGKLQLYGKIMTKIDLLEKKLESKKKAKFRVVKLDKLLE